MTAIDVQKLALLIQKGNRRALAKAITLVESKSTRDQEAANLLFTQIPPTTTMKTIAISGPPGAGKSTFIDAFGSFLITKGFKIAVLAVDPTSPISGGALLADKTRMTLLSQSENAFIRPTPTGQGVMGGVTAATQDCLQLFAAAGYDFTLLETVGVGQNEVDAHLLSDIFCLLLPPAAGDEIQGLKKGIVELADLLIITKHDTHLKAAAQATAQAYQSAIGSLSTHQKPLFLCSAVDKTGFDELFEALQGLTITSSPRHKWPLIEKRLKEELTDLVLANPKIDKILKDHRDQPIENLSQRIFIKNTLNKVSKLLEKI